MLKKVIITGVFTSVIMVGQVKSQENCCAGKNSSCHSECNALTANCSVNFFKGTYQEAVELSRKSQKTLLLDAFAVWCTPCKTMDKKTFTNTDVIRELNENFIVFKFDVEKDEGIELTKKLKIESYPTLILMDANQKLLAKEAGYKNVDEFLKWINKYKKQQL